MKQKQDIFDINNTNDLPKKLRGKLSIPKANTAAVKNKVQKGTADIISLFELKKELTIDEILVGLYRKYKVEKTKAGVMYTLRVLLKSKFIKKKGRGLFVKR